MPTLPKTLRRSLASLLLATAFTAPLATTAPGHAQSMRALPSPVAATELESLLRDAGVEQSTIDIALPLHEAYFKAFREFEEREVDASLKNAPTPGFDMAPSLDDARRMADARRRIFARAAQIDAQLVDQITGALTADAAAKVESLRNALARRRAIAAIPNMGFGKGAHAFDLRSANAIASLDASSRAALAAQLGSYETELTRQLERLAEASFVRRVRAAEAREKLGVSASPPADGDTGAWLRKMQEVQRTAREEMTAIDARIRKLHRDTLAAIAPSLSPLAADAVRSQFVREVYPAIGVSGDVDAVRKVVESMRAKGSLDDARWTEAEGIVRAHGAELGPVLDAMLAILDTRAANGDGEMFALGVNDLQQEPDRLEPLREQANAVIVRNANALRDAIGVKPAEDKPELAGRGIDLGNMNIEGGIQIMAIGGDGEAISLGAEDLADGGIVLGGFFGGGGGGGIVKPMSREELDRVAERLGFAADTRTVFDEIVARSAEARNAAEQADSAKKPPKPEPAPGETAAISVTLSIGDDGAVTLGDDGPTNPRAIADAVAAAEERMFEELKAVADPSKADAAEAARRARARVRLLVDERGAQSADIVAITDAAMLDAAQRAKVADELRGWDESSVDALRAMREEVRRANEEREELMKQASQTEEVSQPNGEQRQISRAVKIEGDTVEKLQRLDARTQDARAKIIARNRGAIDAIVAKLESDPAAAKAVRRGFYRVVEPAAYRIARDLEPFFTKAAAIEGLKPEARAKIDAMRSEWIESREALCEAYAAEREKERAEAKPDNGGRVVPLGALGLNSQARKRLASDLEQSEATAYRKLRELLDIEVGATNAASIGELPAKKKRNAPAIQFGG